MTRLENFIKEPGSAITHFAGMVGALLFTVPLLSKATDTIHSISFAIFALSMILLYGASTTYHTFDVSEKINTVLKKNRPSYDICAYRRFLHSCVSYRFKW